MPVSLYGLRAVVSIVLIYILIVVPFPAQTIPSHLRESLPSAKLILILDSWSLWTNPVRVEADNTPWTIAGIAQLASPVFVALALLAFLDKSELDSDLPWASPALIRPVPVLLGWLLEVLAVPWLETAETGVPCLVLLSSCALAPLMVLVGASLSAPVTENAICCSTEKTRICRTRLQCILSALQQLVGDGIE